MDTSKQPLRLFYALWPDDATRTALMDMQARIQGRKTRYQNFHLTLAFLGQQPAGLLPALKKILADLSHAQISLVLDRLGYFTKNRIAWAGMHDVPEALIALQRDLAHKLAQNNIAYDDRSGFWPHFTLAREAAPPEDLPFTPIEWRADKVTLVKSTTEPEGVVYRVIATRHLDDAF